MSILIRSIIGRKAFSAERKGNWSKHYHKLRANWHLWTKRNFCQQKKERKDKTWLEQTLQKLWQHQHTFLLILWITSTHAFPKMLFLINPNWVNIGYRGNLLPFFFEVGIEIWSIACTSGRKCKSQNGIHNFTPLSAGAINNWVTVDTFTSSSLKG